MEGCFVSIVDPMVPSALYGLLNPVWEMSKSTPLQSGQNTGSNDFVHAESSDNPVPLEKAKPIESPAYQQDLGPTRRVFHRNTDPAFTGENHHCRGSPQFPFLDFHGQHRIHRSV